MDLDETDRALIRALLEDADRSLRELADVAGVSAPTVASRIERLEALGILGPARRAVDLTRLGTLLLIRAPERARPTLVDHPRVFHVWETAEGGCVALALTGKPEEGDDLRATLPEAEIIQLARERLAETPPFTRRGVRTSCDACGRPIEGDEGREVRMGEVRLVACCPTCEQALLDAHEEERANAVRVPGPVTGPVSRSRPGTCDQCGSPIGEDEDGIEVELGGRPYVVCCPGCKAAIEARYERHQDAS